MHQPYRRCNPNHFLMTATDGQFLNVARTVFVFEPERNKCVVPNRDRETRTDGWKTLPDEGHDYRGCHNITLRCLFINLELVKPKHESMQEPSPELWKKHRNCKIEVTRSKWTRLDRLCTLWAKVQSELGAFVACELALVECSRFQWAAVCVTCWIFSFV